MHLHRATTSISRDNIISFLQLFVHRSSSVPLSSYQRYFACSRRTYCGDLRLKVLFREEIILYAVLFARTGARVVAEIERTASRPLAQQPGQHCALKPALDGPVNTYNVPFTHLLVLFSVSPAKRAATVSGCRALSTTWSLSMMSTARVRPVGAVHDHAAVAASCTVRLTGAIPG